MIKKVGSQYIVYNEYGKRMGSYKSLKDAKKRLNMNRYFNTKKPSLIMKDSNEDKGWKKEGSNLLYGYS